MGIIKELERDFKGILSVHSTKEVAELMKDWTVDICTDMHLYMSKVINGDNIQVACIKCPNNYVGVVANKKGDN